MIQEYRYETQVASIWSRCLYSKPVILMLCLLGFLMTSLFAQPKAAFIGMSAFLPGTGEIALGSTSRGMALLTLDVVAITSYFNTDKELKLQQDNYKQYAFHYAGVPLAMPNKHYQVVQEYMSSTDFNKFQEMMARNYFVIYHNNNEAFMDYMAANTYSGDESWEWVSEMHWKNYKSMRRKHQKTKINQNLAIGAMLLNRAFSVIDTAVLARKHQDKHSVYVTPTQDAGLMLNYEIKF